MDYQPMLLKMLSFKQLMSAAVNNSCIHITQMLRPMGKCSFACLGSYFRERYKIVNDILLPFQLHKES